MKKFLSLIFLVLAAAGSVAAQTTDPVLLNIVGKLKQLSADKAIEKAYLHFDKPYYAAGDTMYFKAYVTYGERHDLSKASGILYADLITPKNVVAHSIRMQLIGGLAWGDFILPDTLASGNYRVRAYTRYMNNTGTDYYFDQTIQVGSAQNHNSSVNYTTGVLKPDVQFFAEGGHLVNAMNNHVGFKAVGVNGLGVNIKGSIVDNAGAEVVKITSTHLGMGVFNLIPEEGKTYRAKLTFANGSQDIVDLPKAEQAGITLAVKDTLDKLNIDIRSNKAYFQQNQNKNYHLVIYSGGYLIKVTTKLDNRTLSLEIPNNQFPTGIVQTTLFSAEGEPLSERLSFIRNAPEMNIALNADKTVYDKRGEVHLSLNAKNGKGEVSQGHFSVAVIDESKVHINEDAEHTILNYLLLTADLKGYVEQPNYYFLHDDATTRADLDALLLTQGFRRFTWKQLLDNNAPAFVYKPEAGVVQIAGTLTAGGQPVAGQQMVLRSNNNVLTDKTDDKGHFTFGNLVFFDGTDFVLQPESGKNKKAIQIKIDNNIVSVPVNPNTTPGLTQDVNAPMMAYLDNSRRWLEVQNPTVPGKQLKTVKVTEKNNYKSSNLGGAGHADQVIKGEEIAGAASISDGLNGRVSGVDFTQAAAYMKSNTVITNGSMVAEPMLVMVDGAKGALNTISPNDVETIEILKGSSASIYGMEGGAGVIVITTKNGGQINGAPVVSANGSLDFKPSGFYKAREFYSPKYTPQAATVKPDLRSTIYWQPEVTTDKDGNASISYFNADGMGSYRVVVEGIDANGNIGRQVYRYKVQ